MNNQKIRMYNPGKIVNGDMYLNEAGRLVEISIHTKKYRIISSPTHYYGKKTYYSLNNNRTIKK